MKKWNLGYLAIAFSAIIFGFTPILSSISYGQGNNGINMAFLRAAVPIPVFLIICGKSFHPGKKQLITGIIAGCFSFGCTLLLYSSYEYISPGLATTLHFLYPLYVTVFSSCRRHTRPGREYIIGLVLSVLGIVLFLNPEDIQGKITGYILAVASGVVYSFYILLLEKESDEPLPLYHLMLIISCTGVVLCGITGLALGKLTIMISGKGWLFACLVALLTAVVASVLFQTGVRKTGGTNAAIFSLLEPISSVLFSVILLGDILTLKTIIGCVLIICGLVVVTTIKPAIGTAGVSPDSRGCAGNGRPG